MPTADPYIGRELSHYHIVERVGAGGMGVVYRARDEHLHRDVAIKVLPHDALQDEAARRRFQKEALALSKFNHPHICSVFDFDHQDGIDFLVLEYIQGEPLSARIDRGAIPEKEVIRLGRQIGEALQAAHERGVIHRDLKPSNVMLLSDGTAKVLDFGLAKEERPAGPAETTLSRTETGGLFGTLPYMAPEQLRGAPVDARTDVHALGLVLYEMATGRRPFSGETPTALSDAILHHAPTPPRQRNRKISRSPEAVILRCLEKEPPRRYASARAVVDALEGLGSGGGRLEVLRRASRRHRIPIASAAAVVLLALVAGLMSREGSRLPGGRGCAAQTFHALAVLPLSNLTGDPNQEFFADGMTEELITCLGQIRSLRVTSRSSVMEYKKKSKPMPAIGRDLGVDLVVEGAILRSGNTVRISAKLIEAAADRLLWSGSFDRNVSDLLALQSDVARLLVDQVRLKLSPEERASLEPKKSIDPAVYEDYLKALTYSKRWNKEDWEEAMRLYTSVIERAPDFAPAHAGLAVSCLQVSSAWLPAEEAMPRARAAAQRAVEIDPNLALAHGVLAYVRSFYEFDWTHGEAEFQRAIALNPSDSFLRVWYGNLLTVTARFAEAREQMRRAREVDPLSPYSATFSLFPLYEGRSYDETIRSAGQLIQADPQTPHYRFIRGQAYLVKGDPRSAMEDFQAALRLEPSPVYRVYIARAARALGDERTAQQIRGDVLGSKEYVQPYVLAVLYLTFGEREKALTELERTLETKSEEIVFVKVDPVMDPLRNEPRYQALLRRVGLAS